MVCHLGLCHGLWISIYAVAGWLHSTIYWECNITTPPPQIVSSASSITELTEHQLHLPTHLCACAKFELGLKLMFDLLIDSSTKSIFFFFHCDNELSPISYPWFKLWLWTLAAFVSESISLPMTGPTNFLPIPGILVTGFTSHIFVFRLTVVPLFSHFPIPILLRIDRQSGSNNICTL
jgi:hypothetical protein